MLLNLIPRLKILTVGDKDDPRGVPANVEMTSEMVSLNRGCVVLFSTSWIWSWLDWDLDWDLKLDMELNM